MLLRATRVSDGRSVILKQLTDACAPHKAQYRLQREFDISAGIRSARIAQPLAVESFGSAPALVLEDVGGTALSDTLKRSGPLSPSRFLPIAIELTEGLAEVHDSGVIHKDIKPSNVMYVEATGAVKLIDFGIASIAPAEHQSLGGFEGTFAYTSPEQTGRMNRGVDHRTDLYSLGVLFYEALAGELPFTAADPLEWIHCHVARHPRPLHELRPAVPQGLSRVVMRLLAKVAEDRYQTARGLLADLRHCERELDLTGTIAPFELGRADHAERLHLPQRLYGREPETARLLSLFERMIACGERQLALIGGYSGVGKSALVHELLKPIVRERALFIAGKFDQFNRDVPYATLVQALDDLAAQLLAMTEDRIAAWRKCILDAVGDNGALVTELIPRLEHVIGKQPPVAPLSPSEAQHRFNHVFHALLGVFSTRESPLVIFLDDLQWADAGSLNLLQYVLTQPPNRHLMVVCAYRDNEVSVSHPFILTIEEIRRGGCPIETLVLAPLSVAHVAEFLADAFHREEAPNRALAELLYQKTGGNPFFLIQFVRTLHQDGLVYRAGRGEPWEWDTDRIRSRNFTDNVVDLMTSKLQRFPRETRQMLQWMACIGNRVHADVLACAAELGPNDVDRILSDALRTGLVVQGDEVYRFLHDRVQQAAYALGDSAEQAATHLRLGRLLLEGTPDALLEERIFDIVSQFNRGAGLITDSAERARLAQLNLRAGRRAMASSAYGSAASYFEQGVSFLPADAWESHYDLAFPLHQLQAECAFLTGQHDRARALFEILIPQARTVPDRARAYLTKVDYHTLRGEMRQALDTGLEGLSRLGVEVPAHPTPADVEAEFGRLFSALATRSIDSLLDLPENQRPDIRGAMAINVAMGPAAIFADANLFALLSARQASDSIEFGYAEPVALGNAWLGFVLVGMDKIPEGCAFGRLALKLVERYDLTAYRGRVGLLSIYILGVWERHIRDGLLPSPSPFDGAINAGDITFACYASNQIPLIRMVGGDRLDDLLTEVEHRIGFVRTCKFTEVEDTLIAMQRHVANLQGRTHGAQTYAGDDFDAATFEAALATKSGYANAWYHTTLLSTLVFQGCFAEARVAGERARAALAAVVAQVQTAEIYFYNAVAAAALASTAGTEVREALLGEVREAEQRYVLWARHCPANFENRLALLRAELARLQGDVVGALQAYEAALASAKAHRFIQNAALAAERAAAFHRQQGLATSALALLQKAAALYEAWGATGKVQRLQAEHAELAASAAQQPITHTTTTFTRATSFDTLTVAKASHAIAREIDLRQLLPALARIVLENAGGQRAVVVVKNREQLVIQASVDATGVDVRVEHARPIDEESDVPASIVHYVARTGEGVVLGDPTASHFENDPYVRRAQPKSAMCVPMAYQLRLVGVLYLESHVAADLFTRDRFEMVELLAAQAAIAIENAQLYGQIQDKSRELAQANERLEIQVADRTAELRRTVAELWSEMDLAQKIQTVLLPPKIRVPGYEGSARMLAASTVGGDYYDVVATPGSDWVLIGDVSGHGVTAGLVMMMVHAAVRTAVRAASERAEVLGPSRLLTTVDAAVRPSLTRIGKGQYMTIVALRVQGDHIEYAGGHLDLLVYRAASGRVERRATHGVWLGVLEDSSGIGDDGSLQLEDGDVVLLYTDGVTEARDRDGHFLTSEGLARLFGEVAASDVGPPQIIDHVFAALAGYRLADDATLVVLRRRAALRNTSS